MKKLLFPIVFGGSFLLGREFAKYLNRKNSLSSKEQPDTNLHKNEELNFYDSHHIRICNESMLNKRILPLESAINMREIGGYSNPKGQKIKWNKIYRGEELSHLNEEDHKKFNDLGINYIIDFREKNKAIQKPDLEVPGAENRNISVLEGLPRIELDYNDPSSVDKFMKFIYEAQVRERAHKYAEVLKILRDDPEAKIYIHCTNGKDRTGFMIALIMLIAGIDEEKIISEYTLTNLTFDQAFETLGSTMANEVRVKDASTLKGFFGVDPDWLKIQLDYIKDNYGNVDNYLIQNTDLTQEDINTIRKNILD